MQHEDSWVITLPLRAPEQNKMRHEHLRVGVTADTLNVHIAGQEDAPFLGGELCGRINPARCWWKVRPCVRAIDSQKIDEIELHLVKEKKSYWYNLIRKHYA